MPRKVNTSPGVSINPITGAFNLRTVVEDKNQEPTITREDVTKLSVTKKKITRVDFPSGDYKILTYNNDFTVNTIEENIDGVSIIYTMNYDVDGNVTSKTVL